MKAVNPIHFFDHRGQSVLSADHLAVENDKLRKDIEELKRRNRTLTLRLKTFAEGTENSISLNS